MNLTTYELIMGGIAVISIVGNILFWISKKKNKELAESIYSQLYDIIYRIDESIEHGQNQISCLEIKNYLNQVRITSVALNRAIGGKERPIIPWAYGEEVMKEKRPSPPKGRPKEWKENKEE